MVAKTVTFGVLLIAGVHPVCAQSDRMHRDDANRDGMITRSEWRGRISEFRDLDLNRDGMLSGNEVPSNRRDGERNPDDRRTSSRNSDESGQGGPERAGKLDKNASGVVEGYEWPYNSAVFHKLDTDGDSVLSASELKNI